MRFIIILLMFSYHTFANNLCENDYKEIQYDIDDFQITECNCECTMQDNDFFIKKDNIQYKLSSISKVINKDFTNRHVNINPAINYFLSNKSLCNINIKLEKDKLYLLTLIPSNDGYCYEVSGYIKKNGSIEILKEYVQFKINQRPIPLMFKTIQPNKQPLYKTPNKKTKMYLIKGDKVEILKEKDDWLYILYKGKKDIKAWIPKSSVE